MKKRYIALGIAVLAVSMTACGKKEKENIETTTEMTTEVSSETTETQSQTTTAAATTEQTTAAAEKKPQASTVKSSEIGKNVNNAEPKTDAASPISGVSNAIFLNVSDTVREQANNSYREVLQNYFKEDSRNEKKDIADINATLDEWEAMYKDTNDKAYSETATDLLMAYSRLAALDNIINANIDKLTDAQLAEHDKIAFDLQGNVEIFLNTNNITVLAGEDDFACLNRINSLRSEVEAQISKPVEETTSAAE